VNVSWVFPYVNYYYEVKLGGVATVWSASYGWFPNSVQIFGEITNMVAQLPGDPSNRFGFKSAQYRVADNGSWLDMGVSPTNNQLGQYGVSQPATDWYLIWDKAGDCSG
jgi:hypothetical protein